jgi:hypothetical protein
MQKEQHPVIRFAAVPYTKSTVSLTLFSISLELLRL